MADERSAEQIQRDIEQSRAQLAQTVDQLAYRTDPKRLVKETKQKLKDAANSTPGRIAIGSAGAVVVLLVVARVRKAHANKARAKR